MSLIEYSGKITEQELGSGLGNKLENLVRGINVKDNGLLGNDTNNDATQLNTLLTSIGTTKTDLYFPAGTYKIGTNVTIGNNINLTMANGAVFKVYNGYSITGNGCMIDAGLWQIFDLSLGGTVGGTWNIKEAYPEWFGAKGDDATTDDTDALIDTFSSFTTINLNGKKYLYSSTITIDNKDDLQINNGTLKFADGTIGSNVGNLSPFNVTNCSNFKSKNVTYDTNGTFMLRPLYGQTGYSDYIDIRDKTYQTLRLDSVDGFTLEGCIFTHGKSGIFVASCTNGNITKCKSYETLADGFFITGASKNVKITECTSEKVQDDNFTLIGFTSDDTTNPRYCSINDCIAIDCFGSLVTLLSTSYTNADNVIGTGNKYIPYKLGQTEISGSYAKAGHHQTISNCKVKLSNTIQSLTSNTSPLVDTASDSSSSFNKLINCDIEYSGSEIIFIVERSPNFSMENCNFNGATIEIYDSNVLKIANCNIDVYSAFKIERCSSVRFNGNKVYSNSATDNTVKFYDCEKVKAKGNTITHHVDKKSFSIYNNTVKNNFDIDDLDVEVNGSPRDVRLPNYYVSNTNIFFAQGQILFDSSNRIIVLTSSGGGAKVVTVT